MYWGKYRRLGDRFNEHLYSVETEVDCLFGEHFRRKFHSKSDMQVTVPVETYTGEKPLQFHKQRNINHLGTLTPRGMNVKKLFYERRAVNYQPFSTQTIFIHPPF